MSAPRKLTVRVQANGNKIQITVGEGKQTFKWLANVVTEQLKSIISAKLKVGDVGASVVGFTDLSGDEIHPMDFLYQYSSDSVNTMDFIAKVIETIPSDDYGNPLYSEFQKAAFLCSESSRKWALETDAWRDRGSNAYEHLSNSTSHSSHMVYIGELSSQELEGAFELDWQKINWGWLGFASTDNSLQDIKDVLKSHFRVICNIFNHYCGDGQEQILSA
eukprot:gene10142-21153_t